MALHAWIILNGLDAILTWVSLSLGAIEGNPFLSTLNDSLGTQHMLLIKFLSAVVIGVIIWQRGRWQMWKFLNWGMVGVVTWNMIIIGYTL